MSTRWLWLLLVAAPAQAAESLAFGPVPAWVRPAPPAPAKATGAAGAVGFGLIDTQHRFDGPVRRQFQRIITRANSAEALALMGNISVSWDPVTDVATVHRLEIRRAGAVIDVLKAQSFTVIRREGRLEQRMLDGELTAVLQIADLRVGDEVLLETSSEQSNPLLGGHVESVLSVGLSGLRLDRTRLRMAWPASRRVQWRAGPGLPPLKPVRQNDETVLELALDDLRTQPPPAGAPGRFAWANVLQVSDFADWGEVAALFRPLYADAAAIAAGSPLAAEADRIAAASPDPRRRAELALALVQRDVRYVANVAGLGGYRPVAAADVWRDRFGDCKGKTVLLMALLRRLGIPAEAALVSATNSDGIETALPMPARFDHVIVKAEVAGRTVWLDGTRPGDTGNAEGAAFGWALPLDGGALVAVPPEAQNAPQTEIATRIDAGDGLHATAKVTAEAVFRGLGGQALAAAVAMLDDQARTKAVTEWWQNRNADFRITTAALTTDAASGDVRMTMAGTMADGWIDVSSGQEEIASSRLGRDIAPKRTDGPFADAPVAIAADWTLTRQTIVLPNGGDGFWVTGDKLDATHGGVAYARQHSLTGNMLTMTASTRTAAHEVPLADARAADKATDDLYAKRLVLRLVPDAYRLTAADRKALAAGAATAETPDTPAGKAMAAARAADEQRDWEGVLKALAAVPAGTAREAAWYRMQARAQIQLGDAVGSQATVAAGLAVAPRDTWLLRGHAEALSRAGRHPDAEILLDRLLLIEPENANNYRLRGMLRIEAGEIDTGIADFDAAFRLDPGSAQLRRQKIWALRAPRPDLALAEATSAATAFPDDSDLHRLHAELLAAAGRKAEAKAALARALAIRPEPAVYLARARLELSGTVPAQFEDIIAAWKLNPEYTVNPATLKRVLTLPDALARLGAIIDAAILAQPANHELHQQHANLFEAAGRLPEAVAALDNWVRLEPKSAQAWNNRCWLRATNRIELDKALADCDEAVRIKPLPSFLDSRALVHLQRGDLARALADYDRALLRYRDQPPTLFGRGMTKQALGDAAGAAADFAAARKLDPDVDADWGQFVLALPLPPLPPAKARN